MLICRESFRSCTSFSGLPCLRRKPVANSSGLPTPALQPQFGQGFFTQGVYGFFSRHDIEFQIVEIFEILFDTGCQTALSQHLHPGAVQLPFDLVDLNFHTRIGPETGPDALQRGHAGRLAKILWVRLDHQSPCLLPAPSDGQQFAHLSGVFVRCATESCGEVGNIPLGADAIVTVAMNPIIPAVLLFPLSACVLPLKTLLFSISFLPAGQVPPYPWCRRDRLLFQIL